MITVNRSNLAKAWGLTGQVAGVQSTLSAIRGIRIGRDAYDESIELSATDLTMSIRMLVKVAPNGVDAPVIMSVKDFGNVLNAIPTSVVFMSTGGSKIINHCTTVLSYVGGEIKIAATDDKDFPTLPPFLGHDANWATIPLDDFRRMIKMTVVAAGKDDGRPVLQSVLITYAPIVDDSHLGLLKFAATDGYRLAIASAQIDCWTGYWSMLVPDSTLRMLSKIAFYADPKQFSVSIDDIAKRATFRFIGKEGAPYIETQLTTMLIDGKFPDTDAILKQAQRANVQATVSKMQLQQELRIAACFASEQYSVVKMIVGQGKITLKTSSVIGEYFGEMGIEGGGATPLEVSLGVRLFR